MIEYIKGELTELTPAQAVVETGGIGYALNISLNSYTAIQGKKEVKLYVHESLQTGGRDDNYTFYGFATRRERELYRLLITVSGVGANTARIAEELHVSASHQQGTTVNTGIRDEAVSALTMLGFAPVSSAKVVTAILTEQPELAVEMVVKEALKRIK